MKIDGRVKLVDSNNKEISQSGHIVFEDIVRAKTIVAKGDVSFEKMHIDKVEIKGRVNGDTIEAETIFIDGQMRIRSLFANEIKLCLSQENIIGKIKCKSIDLYRNESRNPEVVKGIFQSLFKRNFDFTEDKCDQTNIEEVVAQNVNLSECHVILVKCQNANIGKGAVIDELVCENDPVVTGDVTIKKQSKSCYEDL